VFAYLPLGNSRGFTTYLPVWLMLMTGWVAADCGSVRRRHVMWLGFSHLLDKIDIREVPVTSAHVTVSDTARDLGVIIDSWLTMVDHVAAVCRSCYYLLRQLRSVAPSLSSEAAKAVVHAFISCRMDYCNSLLTGVNDGLLRRLQSVQNAAARLVTGTRRWEHITSALRQLHWLPVRQRIHYKLVSLAFRTLSGLAPDYLAGDCQLVAESGRRSLRSAERRVCSVPRQNSTFGDRSWAACMEWAAVQSTWHWTIADCLQCTPEDAFVFHLVWGHGAFVTFMISLRRI